MKLSQQLSAILIVFLSMLTFMLQAQATSEKKSFSIDLKKGQLLSMIEPLSKAGANNVVKQYYQTAIPLAQKHGFENKGSLISQKTIIGNYAPQGIVFATWPSQAAEKSFADEPQWPSLKKLRPLAWEELKIFTAEVKQDTTLEFDAKKHYTLAIAWFNPEHPNDYPQYVKNIESVLTESGGRFVYKMLNPSFEALSSKQTAPNQLTIVEWDDVDGLQKLQAKEEYQSHLHLLQNGVVDFELHLLSTPTLKNG